MLVLEKELTPQRKITNSVLRSFLYIEKTSLEGKCGKTNRRCPGFVIVPGEGYARRRSHALAPGLHYFFCFKMAPTAP